MIRYHRTIGMWMRNNWGLWRGSRLKQYFNNLGVNHPDDMSAIILTSFWRHLHKQPIKLEEQIKVCQDYWAKGIKINRRTTGLQLDYDVSEELK